MEEQKERFQQVKQKRLVIDVDEELHTKIKSEVVQKNISIRKWVLRLVVAELKRLESYK